MKDNSDKARDVGWECSMTWMEMCSRKASGERMNLQL